MELLYRARNLFATLSGARKFTPSRKTAIKVSAKEIKDTFASGNHRAFPRELLRD